MDRRFRSLGVTIALLVAGASLTVMQSPATAAFPGGNGAIAYQCSFGGNTEICVGNVDGSNQRQLTADPSFGNDDPAWSPNGARIAFERRTSSTSNSTDLVVMNANGNGLTQLTDTPGISESDPAWSPDGTKLVYAADNGQQSQLFVMQLASLSTQALPGTVDGFAPAWSPNGASIAFSSYAEGDESCEFGPCTPSAEVLVIPASGGQTVNITEHNEAHDLFPNWSVDSTRVLIERRPHPNDALGRMLDIELAGENDFLSLGDGNRPAFSPNGELYVYDKNGAIHWGERPETDEVEPVFTVTSLQGVHPDWQPCPNNVCPSTAATTQTQSTTTVTAKRVKTKIKANGLLDPAHPGSKMTVTLLKKKNGVFSAVKTASPTIAADGKFAATFKRPGKGQCQVTARFPGDDDHASSQASKTLKC